MSSSADTRRKLFALCEHFILVNQIHDPESIYQMDNVISNAYEFIEEMCELIGYADYVEYNDEDEETEEE